MADWRVGVLQALGAKPSPSALSFLQGWQRKEGGATNNAAAFNWLNRTGQGQYPTINRVGVEAYPNYQTGVARTAQLIQSGYPAIYNALRSGQVSYQDPNLQADLNRWVSGNRTPGMTPYVRSVASLAGSSVGAAAAAGSGGSSPSAPTMLQQRPRIGLSQLLPLVAAFSQRRQARAAGETVGLAPLLGAIMGMRATSPSLPVAPSPVAPAPAAPAASGNALQLPTNWQGTHVTADLGWGTKTAVDLDIGAAPGTPVESPVAGTVEYFHPEGAQGGGSMMIRGDNGQEYWIGHIARGVPAGTRVAHGSQIAVIANQNVSAPHVHLDRRRIR